MSACVLLELAAPRVLEPLEKMVKLVPKGSPFNPAALSVVSYNLLAPLYVRPLDARTGCVQAFAAFQWAEPADEVLDLSLIHI